MSAQLTPALPAKTITAHVLVAVMIGVSMALCYLGGFHKPDPHAVRVDVIGSGQTAQAVAGAVAEQAGDHFQVGITPSVESAKSAIEHRDLAGAVAMTPTEQTLYVSTAAGDATATILQRSFGQVASAKNQVLHVVDVVPSDAEHDPAGGGIFFLMVALTVGAYGAGLAIAVAAGGRSIWVRLAFIGVFSVVVPAVVTGIAAFVYHALLSAGWAIFGLGIPYTLAVILTVAGLHIIIGRFTTLVTVTLFVALNFTSSGGVYAPELQPRFFAALHDFWLGAGYNEAARNLMYFPNVGIAADLWKVFGWVIGAGVLVAAAAVYERRKAAHDGTPAAPASHELNAEQYEELVEEVVG
ncbi:MAG: hypothetical protein QM774_13615 [Gordonia sp. (in: high G+C Gram-positive bacteria)]|uniref:hypothetical protein n=1 Tax=Gordonia sp. (in: high G+C Gram-positive bacteria) TaxID=84139 RepID=UPI0039E72659